MPEVSSMVNRSFQCGEDLVIQVVAAQDGTS
jgi:hypothetical protein